jgi:hypothetical protein
MATRYHWQDGDADTDIVPLPPTPPRRRPRGALIVGAVAVAALAIAGAVVWQRAEHGQRAAQSDLQAVVDAEAAALQRGDEEVFLSLQDLSQRQWYRDQELYWDAVQRASEEEPRAEVGDLAITEVELRDDRAWVEVQYTLDGVPYRKAQFYRLLDGHWRHTAPDARFWGERREIDTPHLHFVTNEREEPIVRPVAEGLEMLFEQVRSDFVLQDMTRQVIFEFQPVAEAGPALYSEAHFVVPSPLLLGVRCDGHLDTDLLASLAQSVGLFLAIEKSGLYVREPGPGSSWAMLKGVVAWEIEQRLAQSVVPAEWTRWLQGAITRDTLAPLAGLWPPFEFHTERDSALAFVQAQSVVGYAVELRGMEVLPVLLEALGAKLSAEETIRAAVQMDLAAFEAAWRAHIGDLATAESRAPGPGAGAWRYGKRSTSVAMWKPLEEVPPPVPGCVVYRRPCADGMCGQLEVCPSSVSALDYGASMYHGRSAN